MPESIHVREAEGVLMIVVIDSTARGPALGGCRWKAYPDTRAARRDAVALAAAMTRKSALARLSLGGGKAVVAGDPRQRSDAQLRAFGALVEELGGRYITAADMGTGAAQMAVIAQTTRHVVGLPRERGGCGDPAPFTARGVRLAMEAALAARGRELADAHVAVQGVGHVGRELVRLLLEAGARVTAADPAPGALEGLPQEVRSASPDALLETECDVLAPCGPPGVIDAARAARLRCGVVCGAANNPLATPESAAALERRGILYVPDFLANAGGLIHLAVSLEGGDAAGSTAALSVIPENLERVLERAKSRAIDTARAAEELALEAVAAGRGGEPAGPPR